jgi:flagellar biosynthetic protein FliR
MEQWNLPGLDRALPLLWSGLVDNALSEVARFGLVLVRFSGLMILGPLFGQSSLPMNVRVLLVFALALIVTPALPGHASRGFERLDANRDGWLAQDEVPPGLQDRFRSIVLASHPELTPGLTREDYAALRPTPFPTTLPGYVVAAVGELSLGLLLGLGVMTVLSGLQLAGQIIDQQAGFSLGEIINPDFDSTGSVSGQTLMLLGTTLFLVLEPLGGHLLMLRTLVQTFETLPVGEAFVSLSAMELVGGLVQEALILGIRVAAPLVVMMTLIDLTLGFLSHSVPQVNVQAVGFATRAGLCLLILVVLLSGVTETVATAVPNAIAALHEALVFPKGTSIE